MRSFQLLAAWVATLFFTFPTYAWNATGHRVIAAIAYDRLSPQARSRIDELLKHHPDYERMFAAGAPADAQERARWVFIAASTWADQIKGDPRFWDDTRANAQPTPLLPGFPDMKRHTNWHYYDLPYTPDGAKPEPPPVPNALDQLQRIIPLIHQPIDDPANPSYLAPWLIHIVGDVHQPLHCVSRFLKSQPKGDAGGNFVYVDPGRNLHAVWDDLLGSDSSEPTVLHLAAEIAGEHPAPRRVSKNPKKWIQEGLAIAKRDVYSFGLETGTREKPIHLSADYLDEAHRVGRARVALAGYRLAAVLNEKLK